MDTPLRRRSVGLLGAAIVHSAEEIGALLAWHDWPCAHVSNQEAEIRCYVIRVAEGYEIRPIGATSCAREGKVLSALAFHLFSELDRRIRRAQTATTASLA